MGKDLFTYHLNITNFPFIFWKEPQVAKIYSCDNTYFFYLKLGAASLSNHKTIQSLFVLFDKYLPFSIHLLRGDTVSPRGLPPRASVPVIPVPCVPTASHPTGLRLPSIPPHVPPSDSPSLSAHLFAGLSARHCFHLTPESAVTVSVFWVHG